MKFALALLACTADGPGDAANNDTDTSQVATDSGSSNTGDSGSQANDSGNQGTDSGNGGGQDTGDSDRGLEAWGKEDLSSYGYVQSAPGDAHLCALDEVGEIWCWGPSVDDEKYYGQQHAPSGTWASIEAGFFHSCALDADGAATCWGKDDHGESTPPDGVRFTRLSLGSGASCGITVDDGRIMCWGMGNYLTQAPKGQGFVDLDMDIWSGCGITATGELSCWGNTEKGDQYNTGQVEDAPTESGFEVVGLGQFHGCAADSAGTTTCWGLDEDKRTDVPEGVGFVRLVGGDRHECGLTDEGIVYCWGTDGITRPTPEDQELIHMSSGWTFISGIRPDGSLLNWGQENPYNTYMPGWVPDDMKF